jgi:D-serine dehydratase
VSSVFIANQVTGRQALQRLAGLCEQYPQAEFFLIVDSESNAREIAESLAGPVAAGQLIPLIEIGAPGGRTGLRTAGDAGRLARLMKELEIPARGIEAFEGIFNMDEPGRAVEQVHAMLSEIQRAYIEICESGDFADGPCYLSAGGSSFYDLVAHYFQQLQGAPGPRIIVRAGCYISHDSGVCKRAYADLLQRGLIDPGDHLHPALEVWAQVQSQPEPGRAFATAGKRDLSYDIELPVVQWWFRPGMHDVPQAIDKEIEVTALSDQHSHLSLAEGFDLQIGDLLGMGISHPCTTFDKWKYLFTISDDYTVTGAIKTFF